MAETGYDPFAQNILPSSEEQINIETCFGDGKAFPMGPECTFQGKNIAYTVSVERGWWHQWNNSDKHASEAGR